MKSVEKLAYDLLVVYDFGVDALNYNCEQTRVLKSVVFIFYLSLCEGKQIPIVIDTLRNEL